MNVTVFPFFVQLTRTVLNRRPNISTDLIFSPLHHPLIYSSPVFQIIFHPDLLETLPRTRAALQHYLPSPCKKCHPCHANWNFAIGLVLVRPRFEHASAPSTSLEVLNIMCWELANYDPLIDTSMLPMDKAARVASLACMCRRKGKEGLVQKKKRNLVANRRLSISSYSRPIHLLPSTKNFILVIGANVRYSCPMSTTHLTYPYPSHILIRPTINEICL